jgi:aromatic ring-opening dioxygenase catalytic subunit (LigB family)
MDYFGFEPYFYQQTFESKGNRALAERVVMSYKEVSQQRVNHFLHANSEMSVGRRRSQAL